MKEQLQNIKEQALKTIGDCVDVKQLDELRVKYLGKKGELTAILKSMGKLSADERPVMGQLANDVRQSLEGFIAQKHKELREGEFKMIDINGLQIKRHFCFVRAQGQEEAQNRNVFLSVVRLYQLS